ncbi:hypothetical protein A3Q56_04886 [Intoshia linei]|uniref:Retropepsins domain-containing protein n=1 Tax=Intoshia linei TaxID=1819745 RepID=A0A177AZB3_9BILA|nr:hypothetical protein A3Q56_04886 [Intoshia linei]
MEKLMQLQSSQSKTQNLDSKNDICVNYIFGNCNSICNKEHIDPICNKCEINTKQYSLFYIPAKIEGKEVSCLVDTGSVASFLPNTFTPNKKSTSLYFSVTGAKLSITGECRSKIEIKSLKESFIHTCVVSNDVMYPILGLEFLQNNSIDITQNPIRLKINNLNFIFFVRRFEFKSVDLCDPNINGTTNLEAMASLNDNLKNIIYKHKHIFTNKPGKSKNYTHGISKIMKSL